MSKLNKKKLERKLEKYIKKEKFENAFKTANKLSKMYPDTKEYVLTKAFCLEYLGIYEKAAKEYKNTLKFPGNDILDYYIVYYQLGQMDMYEDAFDVVEKGLKIYPNNEQLILDKAMTLILSNRKEDAYKYIDEFPKTNEYWIYLQAIKIDAEINFENPEEAIKICDEILEEDMTVGILDKKVEILFDLRMFDEIENLVNPLLENEEFEDWATLSKISIYGEKGETDKALSLINDYLKKDPKNEAVNVAATFVFFNIEKFEESARCIYNCFDGELSEDIVSLIIALFFFERGKSEPAWNLIEVIPDDSEAYRLSQSFKNIIYNELNDYKMRTKNISYEEFESVIIYIRNGIYDIINEDINKGKKRIIEHLIGKDERLLFKKRIKYKMFQS